MNERIDRIADQIMAEFQDVFGHSDVVVPGKFFERFAELIVRECADEIKKQGRGFVDFAPSKEGIRLEHWDMAEHIKRHFGVE